MITAPVSISVPMSYRTIPIIFVLVPFDEIIQEGMIGSE
jgi:hypothetical protein